MVWWWCRWQLESSYMCVHATSIIQKKKIKCTLIRMHILIIAMHDACAHKYCRTFSNNQNLLCTIVGSIWYYDGMHSTSLEFTQREHQIHEILLGICLLLYLAKEYKWKGINLNRFCNHCLICTTNYLIRNVTSLWKHLFHNKTLSPLCVFPALTIQVGQWSSTLNWICNVCCECCSVHMWHVRMCTCMCVLHVANPLWVSTIPHMCIAIY